MAKAPPPEKGSARVPVPESSLPEPLLLARHRVGTKWAGAEHHSLRGLTSDRQKRGEEPLLPQALPGALGRASALLQTQVQRCGHTRAEAKARDFN